MPTKDNRANLRALQAFEAVSRHNSISRAADELGVTQSAVSHQLRRLSADLGENLIVKSGRGVVLTPTGHRLAEKLHTAFTQIDHSVAEAIGVSRAVVRLALCSCFAPGWLIPRLTSFYTANPDIDLQLRMYARDPMLTDEVADAFVTTPPRNGGYWSIRLADEILVPVVAASLSDSEPRSFITTDLEPGRIGDDWKKYRALAGRELKLPEGKNWLFASHYVMALDMVRAGLGAALVPDFLVASDIASGRIALLDQIGIPTQQDYFLCIKEARRHEPALAALALWFSNELSHK